MSSVPITRTDYHADYAWWGTWYVCPACKSRKVRTDYRYCPNCGAEIDWQLTGEIETNAEKEGDGTATWAGVARWPE